MYHRAHQVGRAHRAWMLRHWRALVGIATLLCILAVAPVFYTMLSTDQDRYDQLYDTPHHKVAIVFGAGVQPNGEPTPYLKRRVETGASLYRHHKVDILLLSGDNRTSHYNEPVAMKKYAQRLGVPADRIVLDYGGYSTYDTCYRAHAIFGLREAVLVSHGYHLPRAMTTCNRLGVQSVGVATQPMSIPGRDYSLNYIVREVLSTDKAMVELLFRPKPAVLGVPEPIK